MSGLDNRFKNNTMSSNQTSIKPTSTQMSSTKTSIPLKNVASDDSSIQNNQVRCDECTKVFYSKDFLALHKINKHSIKKATDHTQSGLLLKNELLNFIKKETNAKALKEFQASNNSVTSYEPTIL